MFPLVILIMSELVLAQQYCEMTHNWPNAKLTKGRNLSPLSKQIYTVIQAESEQDIGYASAGVMIKNPNSSAIIKCYLIFKMSHLIISHLCGVMVPAAVVPNTLIKRY